MATTIAPPPPVTACTCGERCDPFSATCPAAQAELVESQGNQITDILNNGGQVMYGGVYVYPDPRSLGYGLEGCW